MQRIPLRSAGRAAIRNFSATPSRSSKVAILGAAGGIGQPLSLLLKLNPLVTELALYDIRGAPGVAADISHINTKSKVTGYGDQAGLEEALRDANVVLIPAGVPRKPGMTRDDLFNTNASIVRDLAKAVANTAPKAMMCIIANPVNSTVPIVSEVYKAKGVYDPKRLFGVTTLDVLRASRFLSQVVGTDPADENVTVVGGHSGVTIVPLLSQTSHSDISEADRDALVHRIQFGGDEVVKAKDGAGSATLSMAQAGARFASSLLRAAHGESGIVECTFVESPLFKNEGCDFFASKVELSASGVKKIHELGKISDYEQGLVETCLRDLAKNITKGREFVTKST